MRREREVRQVVLRVRLDLLVLLRGPFLAALQQHVNVFVRELLGLGREDLVGAEAHHGHQVLFIDRRVLLREPTLLDDGRV